jgi:hypothetical protein
VGTTTLLGVSSQAKLKQEQLAPHQAAERLLRLMQRPRTVKGAKGVSQRREALLFPEDLGKLIFQ